SLLALSYGEGPLQNLAAKACRDEPFREPGDLEKRYPGDAERLPVFAGERRTDESFRVSAVDHHQFSDERTVAVGKEPAERSAPVGGDEQAAPDAKDFDQGADVVGKGEDVVATFSIGGAGIAARVGCVDAAFGQQVHDVLPAHPAFGESVDAQDGRRVGWA